MSEIGRAELAELLQELKERSGRSYMALARRIGVSRSTLHRYCQGEVVPDSYGLVERIGRVCGADRAELAELYRRWSRAATERDKSSVPTGSTHSAPTTPAEEPMAVAVPSPQPGGRIGAARRMLGGRAGGVVWLATVAVAVVAAATVAGSLARSGAGRPAARQWIPGPSWTQEPPQPVPAALFGVTLNSSSGTMPSFRVGAVRLWDSETRWAQIQPRRGVFGWQTLDRLVAGAERAGLPVLFTFGATPAWASPNGPKAPYPDGSRAAPPDDLADWDRFVRAVVTRYRGRIGAYELWNLAPSPRFFIGDARTLAEMTRRASRSIRRADPKATVVCPGMGELWEPASRQYLLEFAAAGGYQPCDVAAVKLHQRTFGDKPETMVELAGLIERTFHQAGVHPRLWNTGTAYRIATADPLTEQEATSYAVRFYLVGLYVRYERMYFYNWGGTKVPIVLQAEGGTPTRAALFVEELQRWLTGARIRSCGHGLPAGLPGNVWQCRFLLPGAAGAEPAVIRWTDSGTATMTTEPRAYAVRHLDGSSREIHQGEALRITEQPVLVQYHARDSQLESAWPSGLPTLAWA